MLNQFRYNKSKVENYRKKKNLNGYVNFFFFKHEKKKEDVKKFKNFFLALNSNLFKKEKMLSGFCGTVRDFFLRRNKKMQIGVKKNLNKFFFKAENIFFKFRRSKKELNLIYNLKNLN